MVLGQNDRTMSVSHNSDTVIICFILIPKSAKALNLRDILEYSLGVFQIILLLR